MPALGLHPEDAEMTLVVTQAQKGRRGPAGGLWLQGL